MIKCSYKNCNNLFIEKSNKLYCSRNCKQKEKKRKCLKEKMRIKLKKNPYIIFKKNYCEHCNFIPLHPCQLDVDHIDGNHNNNDVNNLQTLCANCHRLKTYINKDWEK